MGRLDRERRDPGKTSSGIAHAYIQPLPFYTESSKDALLPPLLRRQTLVPVSTHFSLPSHTDYGRKPLLRDSSAVKMPSQPISETMDCYRGQSAPPRPLVVHYSPLQALSGQLDANQAPVPRTRVLSTTHTDFRPYSRSELARPPDLGANLTKSSAYSRLPAHKAPPTVSCHPRLALQPMPLPYGGKNSVYKDTFTIPGRHPEISSPATTSDRPKHTNVGDRGLLQDIMEVPKMYNTENQRYGSTELVLV
ncbi:stabilizer of axonemal microtubules 3 [Chanos chanos]|uniref:Stabilizer of axonemal microtubules 3 n=1 Tax=Chanos chanos TaxID=29144 RepID=A0A6J2X054_CHACN|nr:uncharacterized protein LOC115829749 [Chanos chanos]